MPALRLVVFDVDGTLVDSQADIVAAMTQGFNVVGAPVPARAQILGIVGLSLDVAIPRLAPDLTADDHARIVQGYKDSYMSLRADRGIAESSPFYPGARETLQLLAAQPNTLLGVATGKSKRGLDKLIEGHGLQGVFQTQQVADFHPSKPHPSMLLAALRDTGVEVQNAVMIGDTSFDMDMARAAGFGALAVSWGYHDRAALAPLADAVADGYAQVIAKIDDILRGRP